MKLRPRPCVSPWRNAPCPRACAGMCADGLRAFTFGGFDGQSDRSDLWGLSFLPCGFGAAAAAAPAAAAAAVAASGGGSPQTNHAFDSAEATADFRKRQQRMMAELWKAHSVRAQRGHIPLHIRVWQAQFGEEAAEAEAAAGRRGAGGGNSPPPRRRCASDRIYFNSRTAQSHLRPPAQSRFACALAHVRLSISRRLRRTDRAATTGVVAPLGRCPSSGGITSPPPSAGRRPRRRATATSSAGGPTCVRHRRPVGRELDDAILGVDDDAHAALALADGDGELVGAGRHCRGERRAPSVDPEKRPQV